MRRKRGLSLRKNKSISRKINELAKAVGRVLTLEEWMGIVKEYYNEGTMAYDSWKDQWYRYSKWRKNCDTMWKRHKRINKHLKPGDKKEEE